MKFINLKGINKLNVNHLSLDKLLPISKDVFSNLRPIQGKLSTSSDLLGCKYKYW